MTLQTSATVQMTEPCPYCTKGRSVHDIMPFAGGKICQQCYRAHLEALSAMAQGRPPVECSECHATRQQMAEQQTGSEVRMAVHFERGIYRFLCLNCDRDYTRKRRELYGPTEFGHKLGLK